MSLVSIKNLSLAFGEQVLLDRVSLEIQAGERISLLGRNGCGKSTFLRVLQGLQTADEGSFSGLDAHQITALDQEVPFQAQTRVYEVLSLGLPGAGALLNEYHELTRQLAQDPNHGGLNRLAALQHDLDELGAWGLDQKIANICSELNINQDWQLNQLSGGMIRKVLLAKAFMSEPKLLLLDEPTNHLDIATIEWLENVLLKFSGAVLFISHDRAFVQKVSTRILELDRGWMTSWNGGYKDYLEKREHRLAVEQEHHAQFDKKLAQEEQWIRQGIKARRTRNEGRVRALKALRQQREQRRRQGGTARLSGSDGDASGKLVAQLSDVSLTLDGKVLVKDFSLRVLRGDRIGLIGPNGIGKSSWIKLLLQELLPDSGNVELGTKLQVAYFDQQRQQLEPDKSLIDNLNLGSDTVTVNGKSKHVIGYLQDFLFTPQKAREPARNLSGGERNRLMLARILCRPSNVLVLDEPTNDLDVETLELLEELLLDYKGTLILVSHDRSFINNVVSSTLVFEGEGVIREYVGGYDDWLRQRAASEPMQAKILSKSDTKSANLKSKRSKLSYKDQRELAQLPALIEQWEQEKQQVENSVNSVEFYQQDQAIIGETLEQLRILGEKIEQAYAKWEALENG